MLHLQKLVNGSTKDISVHDLQLISKELLSGLKDGEEKKTKNYSALCVMLDHPSLSAEEIALLKLEELVIQQKTPLRVLHRLVRLSIF